MVAGGINEDAVANEQDTDERLVNSNESSMIIGQ